MLFPEHLPLSRIQTGIKSGSFLQGTFRASRDNYLEATVFVQGEGEDGTEVCNSTLVCRCTNLYGVNNYSYLSTGCFNSKVPVSCQVLIQGLQNLNRAVYQDVVAVQLFPQSEWVAPSSVVLQEEGIPKDDSAEEVEEERVVSLGLY